MRGVGRVFVLLLLVVVVSALLGCAGSSARSGVLSPAVVQAWPGVKAEADGNIQRDADAGEDPGSIRIRRSRVRLFDEAVSVLGGGSGSGGGGGS